ncbi:MAG: YbaB/EbfC family nucleoid-associated protein [Phycisphaeraceae bacterium]|nr:YbaB/EbfC family nucleoid-associated protein [Phycisphaerae bacterium]MBX3391949.1 YbaB/EbfC family nucleoid-associated protein [Phycisphaeraceae bacterium]HRJ49508.1 YbaB/EbfC family nucleoid-associated protein [Phycisphaerales bacterium]
MLDRIKAMGALAGFMKNQDALREAGDRIRAEMKATRCVGESGGGAARAVVSGSMEVLEVHLAPALVNGMAADENTRSLAGTLIAQAVNEALRKAQEKLRETLRAEAVSMGLGDLGGLDELADFLR